MRSFLARLSPGQQLLTYWVLAVGFAAIGTTVVVMLYANRVISIAGPFAVLTWLPMLFLLRATVLYRSDRKWHGELRIRLNRAAALLDRELGLPAQQRRLQASEPSLDSAGQLLQAARGTYARGEVSEAVSYTGQLAAVTAEWAPDAAVTKETRLAVRAAQKLGKTWAQRNDLRNSVK